MGRVRTHKASNALTHRQTNAGAELHDAADAGTPRGIIEVSQQAEHDRQRPCVQQSMTKVYVTTPPLLYMSCLLSRQGAQAAICIPPKAIPVSSRKINSSQ